MDDMASRWNSTQPVLLRIGWLCAPAILCWAMTAAAQTVSVVTAKPTAQVLQIVNLPVDKMEASVRGLLGKRLRRIENREADSPGWMYVHSAKQRVELLFDYRQNNVTLRGPEGLVDQLTRLILALERASVPSGRETCVVSLHQADPAQVLRVIEAYRSEPRGGTPPSVGAASQRSSFQEASRPTGDTSSLGVLPAVSPLAAARFAVGQTQLAVYRSQSPDDGVAPVPQSGARAAPPMARLAQQVAPPPPQFAPPTAVQPGTPMTPGQEENAAKQPARAKLRSLDSDLEVETLPDLDAIILRGRPRDLAELRRIVEEIERLGAETQPELEIVYLQHAGSETLGNLIKQVEKEFTGGRQGRVTTIPLVKPNALLLIGWGEALKSA